MKIKRSIKFLFQYIFRGWTDKDTWSLNYTISRFILPRLKRYKELNFGHPEGFTMYSWNETIDKMIFSFEKYSKLYDEEWDQKTADKINEGMDLFRKYFHTLWW